MRRRRRRRWSSSRRARGRNGRQRLEMLAILCGIGSCGVPRPSVADYVTVRDSADGAPAAGTGLMLTTLWVMSPFQIEAGANAPQTTPRKLALPTYVAVALFGSRRDQLPG